MRIVMRTTLAVWIAFSLFSLPAYGSDTAAPETKGPNDLNHYLCKDIMRLSGVNRDVAIGVLHAFYLGKKGTTTFEIERIADATDLFIEECLDNPQQNALQTMAAILDNN